MKQTINTIKHLVNATATGVDNHSRSILRVALLLLALMTVTTAFSQKKKRAWAIWSPKEETLYFVYSTTDYSKMTTYNGKKNIQAWQIAVKNDNSYPSNAKNPRWATTASPSCENVVFKSSFSSARPLSCKGWFKNFEKLKKIEGIDNLNTDFVRDMAHMFDNCSSLTTVNLNNMKFKSVTNMAGMFYGCKKMGKVEFPESKFGKVTKTNNMFANCEGLTSITFGGLKTANVTNMNNMFNNCNRLTNLDLSTFNTKNVEKMKQMFYGCSNLQFILVDDSNWNTEKVDASDNMFYGCEKLVGEDGSTVGTVTDKTVAHTGTGGVLKRLFAAGNYLVSTATGIEHGTVSVSQPTADKEDVILVTVTPDAGYQLAEGSLTVTTGTTSVVIFSESPNQYYFNMPDGDVTVSAAFELAAQPETAYALHGENVHFMVDGAYATEAAEGATVTVVADNGVEPPVGMEFAVVSNNTEDNNYNKPVFVSSEVAITPDGTFTMPAAAVTVTRQLQPKQYELTGNNVEFFEKEYSEEFGMYVVHRVTEGTYGQEIIVSPVPETFPGGYYHDGSYTSSLTPVTITDYEASDGQFIMPAGEVEVSANLVKQGTLTIDLTSAATQDITEETARYMTVMDGYISWGNDNDSYRFDVNLDGTPDFLITGLQTENYMATRLDGANQLEANYAMALRTPGLPLSYKDVVFNIGRETTVSNICLYESASIPNGHTLDTYDGQVVQVALPDRVLWKDGNWNTLSVPFSFYIADSPLNGTGVEARTLESATLDNGVLTLEFGEPVDVIEAGKPYIIKWEKPENYVPFNGNDNFDSCSDLIGPVFKNVALNNCDQPVDIENVVSFTNLYKTITLETEDNTILYLGDNNTLCQPAEGATIGAFRAYFQLLGGYDDEEEEPADAIRSYVMKFGDGASEATGIAEIDSDKGNASGRRADSGKAAAAYDIYSLDGRKLGAAGSDKQKTPQRLPKGLYILKGKKIVTK